jgi:hypothetical protein
MRSQIAHTLPPPVGEVVFVYIPSLPRLGWRVKRIVLKNRKNVNISQLKLIEMVMISNDG